MSVRDDSLNKILEVYEQPLINSVTDTSGYAIQPQEIRIPLRPHQLAMIHAMREKERTCIQGFTVNNEIHYSQTAVLGDKVGSGKTLTTLGFIAHKKHHPINSVFNTINNKSQTTFWSQRPVHTVECSGNVLIIVPHTLFHQWKFAIQQQTTLSFFEVKTTKALEKPDFNDLVKTRDITLMSNTIIKTFMATQSRHEMQWSTVIFDEVDSIHFTSTVPMPRANFYWLVTATWPNILFQGLYMYMSNTFLAQRAAAGLHPDLVELLHQDQVTNGSNFYSRYDIRSANFFSEFLSKHPSRGHLVLRTNKQFMDQSWRSPPVIEQRIICETPVSHRIIAQYVNEEIQELLHAGDIQTALEKLGVNNTSQSSLITALCETREKELDRLEKTLAFKETMDYSTPQAKEQAITSLKTKISSIKEQIASLKQRILNVKDEICAICFDEPKVPTFVLCCERLFCGACIINCIQRNPSCPLCRSALDYKRLRQLDEDSSANSGSTVNRGKNANLEQERKPKKKDALLKLITENRNGKFLVFNRYDNPFLEIEGQLLERGIKVASVKGNKDHISSTLKQFEKGEIQVLLMNSMQAGVGMDLKSATHVVLMHLMKTEEERQIIGRAIRLGRNEQLNLVRLLHDGEERAN
jgi:SNF2 family DNA or RNA helicase